MTLKAPVALVLVRVHSRNCTAARRKHQTLELSLTRSGIPPTSPTGTKCAAIVDCRVYAPYSLNQFNLASKIKHRGGSAARAWRLDLLRHPVFMQSNDSLWRSYLRTGDRIPAPNLSIIDYRGAAVCLSLQSLCCTCVSGEVGLGAGWHGLPFASATTLIPNWKLFTVHNHRPTHSLTHLTWL